MDRASEVDGYLRDLQDELRGLPAADDICREIRTHLADAARAGSDGSRPATGPGELGAPATLARHFAGAAGAAFGYRVRRRLTRAVAWSIAAGLPVLAGMVATTGVPPPGPGTPGFAVARAAGSVVLLATGALMLLTRSPAGWSRPADAHRLLTRTVWSVWAVTIAAVVLATAIGHRVGTVLDAGPHAAWLLAPAAGVAVVAVAVVRPLRGVRLLATVRRLTGAGRRLS